MGRLVVFTIINWPFIFFIVPCALKTFSSVLDAASCCRRRRS